jgi:hypothetical protein
MANRLDLDRLEEVAKSATQGKRTHGVVNIDGVVGITVDGEKVIGFYKRPNHKNDAEFTAACDPETIIAMIYEIRLLRGEISTEATAP